LANRSTTRIAHASSRASDSPIYAVVESMMNTGLRA
jgi:hypothetical protein